MTKRLNTIKAINEAIQQQEEHQAFLKDRNFKLVGKILKGENTYDEWTEAHHEELCAQDKMTHLKNLRKIRRKNYKDEIKSYYDMNDPGNTTLLWRILYTKKIKEWVYEAKPLTTMKNKEFLAQINEFIKEMKEKTGYFSNKKTYNKRCSYAKNRLSELLKDEKRLELLEEYYENNKAYVPNIIRLLKYADSKIQNYFERIETDKRIAERARISEEKTNNWSSECCWAKDEETYRKKRPGYLTYTKKNGVVHDFTSELFKKKCLGDKMNKMNKNFCKCCYNREQSIRKRYIIPNLLIGNHIRVSGFNKNISTNPIVMDKFGDNSFGKDESFMDEWDEAFVKEVMKQMDVVESKMNI